VLTLLVVYGGTLAALGVACAGFIAVKVWRTPVRVVTTFARKHPLRVDLLRKCPDMLCE